jgi:hypothetical protein
MRSRPVRRPARPQALLAAVGAAALVAGCPAPPGALARARQTAQEFNLDARFGRGELVLDKVAPAERDEFSRRHRAWGTDVRVADVELEGMKPSGEHEVDVFVRIAWYRPNEQELKQTIVKQRWHDKADDWQLVGEQRIEGDVGLLGETVVREAPSTPRSPAQFPTVRLSGTTTQ